MRLCQVCIFFYLWVRVPVPCLLINLHTAHNLPPWFPVMTITLGAAPCCPGAGTKNCRAMYYIRRPAHSSPRHSVLGICNLSSLLTPQVCKVLGLLVFQFHEDQAPPDTGVPLRRQNMNRTLLLLQDLGQTAHRPRSQYHSLAAAALNLRPSIMLSITIKEE